MSFSTFSHEMAVGAFGTVDSNTLCVIVRFASVWLSVAIHEVPAFVRTVSVAVSDFPASAVMLPVKVVEAQRMAELEGLIETGSPLSDTVPELSVVDTIGVLVAQAVLLPTQSFRLTSDPVSVLVLLRAMTRSFNDVATEPVF